MKAARSALFAALRASASPIGGLTKPDFKYQAARFLRWRKRHPRPQQTFEQQLALWLDLLRIARLTRHTPKGDSLLRNIGKRRMRKLLRAELAARLAGA